MKKLRWKYNERYRVIFHHESTGKLIIIAETGWRDASEEAKKLHMTRFPDTGTYELQVRHDDINDPNVLNKKRPWTTISW